MSPEGPAREPVPLKDLVLTMAYELAALIELLEERGVLSKREVIARAKTLAEAHRPPAP